MPYLASAEVVAEAVTRVPCGSVRSVSVRVEESPPRGAFDFDIQLDAVGPAEELSRLFSETRGCHPFMGRGGRPPSHPHAPDPAEPRLGGCVVRSIESARSAEGGRADDHEGLAVCANPLRRTFQRCGHDCHEFLRRSAVRLGARGHRGHQLRVLPAAELQAHARDGRHGGSVLGRFERNRALC